MSFLRTVVSICFCALISVSVDAQTITIVNKTSYLFRVENKALPMIDMQLVASAHSTIVRHASTIEFLSQIIGSEDYPVAVSFFLEKNGESLWAFNLFNGAYDASCKKDVIDPVSAACAKDQATIVSADPPNITLTGARGYEGIFQDKEYVVDIHQQKNGDYTITAQSFSLVNSQ